LLLLLLLLLLAPVALALAAAATAVVAACMDAAPLLSVLAGSAAGGAASRCSLPASVAVAVSLSPVAAMRTTRLARWMRGVVAAGATSLAAALRAEGVAMRPPVACAHTQACGTAVGQWTHPHAASEAHAPHARRAPHTLPCRRVWLRR
jgi:hypothetical protein